MAFRVFLYFLAVLAPLLFSSNGYSHIENQEHAGRSVLGSNRISPSEAHSVVKLTRQEKQFIAAHPEIVLGGGITFEPFLIQEVDGRITGHDFELSQLISERTGLNIRFELGNWRGIQDRAQKRDIDGLSSAGFGRGRGQSLNHSTAYIKFMSLVLVRAGNPKQLLRIEDLSSRRVALQQGNLLFEQILKDSVDDPQVVFYETIEELLIALASGEVDYTILDETAYYLVKKIGIDGLIESAFSIGKPFSLMFWLRNDWPEAESIINKGLSSITELERIELRKRWIGDQKQPNDPSSRIQLTHEEQQFLEQKGSLNLCVDPNWLPYENINQNGEHSGIAADYFSLFTQRIGNRIEIVPTKSWDDTLNASKRHRCDIISLAEATPERAIAFDFTTPLLEFHYVVATKKNHSFIEDFEQELDQTFAVHRDHTVSARLRNRYPAIHLIEVANVKEGLEKVQSGEIFGYIDASAAIATTLQQYALPDIKIAGKLPLKSKLSIATRKDEPLLQTIFQKAINATSTAEKKRIYNKWHAVDVKKVADYTLLLMVISATSLILTMFFYWNRKLNESKQQTEQALSKLKKSQEILEKKNILLEQLSITDQLTQLYNRVKLHDVLEYEALRFKRHNNIFGVIMVDIDHFKKVNDLHGHQVGDQIIVCVANLLKQHVRQIDTLGRWGGEEFMVVCPSTTPEGLKNLAERLRQAIENHNFPVVSHKTASFGAAIFESSDCVESIVFKADTALYSAKQRGRNQVVI